MNVCHLPNLDFLSNIISLNNLELPSTGKLTSKWKSTVAVILGSSALLVLAS